MKLNEEKLKDNLRLNKLNNLYFLYGKEAFLVKTYADRIIEKCVNIDDDFNFIKISDNMTVEFLEENIEALPVFADKKVVYVNDFDAEKTGAETLERMIALLSDIPPYCTVIISITGFEPDVKKSKTKKLISCVEKNGAVCEFNLLSQAKTAELIIKKASRNGCVISRLNAEYLADLTLRNLNLIGLEVDKLCSYAGVGGEITKKTIDLLVPRLIEASVFDLAAALTSNNANTAFKIFDDLMSQSFTPVIILATLSNAFTDLYRVRLGKFSGNSHEKTAIDFDYAKNRVWVLSKLARTVNNIKPDYIKKCLEILYKADIKLKSSSIGDRIIIEKAMTEILVAK